MGRSEAARLTGMLVVANESGDSISFFDLDSEQEVALTPDGRTVIAGETSLDVDREPIVIPTGAAAAGLAVTADGDEIWVLDRSSDTISIVDARRLEVTARLPPRPSANRIASSSAIGGARVRTGPAW